MLYPKAAELVSEDVDPLPTVVVLDALAVELNPTDTAPWPVAEADWEIATAAWLFPIDP